MLACIVLACTSVSRKDLVTQSEIRVKALSATIELKESEPCSGCVLVCDKRARGLRNVHWYTLFWHVWSWLLKAQHKHHLCWIDFLFLLPFFTWEHTHGGSTVAKVCNTNKINRRCKQHWTFTLTRSTDQNDQQPCAHKQNYIHAKQPAEEMRMLSQELLQKGMEVEDYLGQSISMKDRTFWNRQGPPLLRRLHNSTLQKYTVLMNRCI